MSASTVAFVFVMVVLRCVSNVTAIPNDCLCGEWVDAANTTYRVFQSQNIWIVATLKANEDNARTTKGLIVKHGDAIYWGRSHVLDWISVDELLWQPVSKKHQLFHWYQLSQAAESTPHSYVADDVLMSSRLSVATNSPRTRSRTRSCSPTPRPRSRTRSRSPVQMIRMIKSKFGLKEGDLYKVISASPSGNSWLLDSHFPGQRCFVLKSHYKKSWEWLLPEKLDC